MVPEYAVSRFRKDNYYEIQFFRKNAFYVADTIFHRTDNNQPFLRLLETFTQNISHKLLDIALVISHIMIVVALKFSHGEPF